MENEDYTVYFLFCFAVGLYWFFKGFMLYRKYRLLGDTPIIPIRAAAMGLVDVHGTACDGEVIKSPVGGTPCFYSSVKIEAYAVSADGNGDWKHIKTASAGSPFYLRDETGGILVDPVGAELDLEQSCQAVAGQVISRPPHPASRPDQPRRDYQPSDFESGGILRLFPKRPGPPPPPIPEPDEKKLLEYVRNVVSNSGAGPEALRGMYRLTEYCIVPGMSCTITGTCAQNPSPRGAPDLSLLKKGENEPTFLISSRSEKNLEKNLRKRALIHIFGGGAAALGSLALVLMEHGWLP